MSDGNGVLIECEDSETEAKITPLVTDKSIHVINTLVVGQDNDREIAALVGTRKKRTWVTGVKELTITVAQEAAGTAELGASVAITFGALNDAEANANLIQGDSVTGESQRKIIRVGESRTFYFTGAGIVRLDAIRNFGSEALNVLIEAG